MERFSSNKDLNKLANDAVAEGWSVVKTNNRHLKWTPPGGGRSFFSSQTPSCKYASKKVAADMKRALRAEQTKEKETTK